MSYAIIDKKSGKILELANNRKGLQDVVVVRLEDLDETLTPSELKAVYREVTGKMRSRLQPKQMVREICQAAGKQNVEDVGKVARARIIFEDMKGQPRKAILEACEKDGINPNTAKTQYYKWKQTLKTVHAKAGKITIQ